MLPRLLAYLPCFVCLLITDFSVALYLIMKKSKNQELVVLKETNEKYEPDDEGTLAISFRDQ